jgi:hypothetical protein
MLQFTPAVPTSGRELSVENLCDSAQQQAVSLISFLFFRSRPVNRYYLSLKL